VQCHFCRDRKEDSQVAAGKERAKLGLGLASKLPFSSDGASLRLKPAFFQALNGTVEEAAEKLWF
jgi:hypothetical protein